MEATTPPTAPRPAGAAPAKPNARARRRWRRAVPYAGAVLLAALITAGLWPQPVPVETAAVTTGLLRATVNEEGKTRIKHRYVVSAPVGGQLQRLDLKPGAEVRAGETLLAVIAPVAPPLLDARSRAQAEARRLAAAAYLERAQAADAFATNELRRFEKLFQEKGVSLQELEAVQWREAAARKEKAAAESALRQAEAELAEFNPGGAPEPGAPPKPTEVRAPAQGRVLRVFEESARVVAPGTPLLELGDPGDLEVVIEVLSSDGAAITAGMRVLFEQWGGGQPLEGQVRLVEPSAFTKVSALGVEEQRVNVVADLLTPAAQRAALGDNFRVEARIIVWEDAQTLKVPAGALFRQGDSWAAFVVSEGRAHRRLVRTGRAGGTETQVTAGLQASEQIILYPGDRVRDGQRVRRIQL